MTTLSDLLVSAREELGNAEPQDLTKLLLDKAFTRLDAKQLVYPAVLAYVQQFERNRTRELEKLAFSGVRPQRSQNWMNDDGSLSDEPKTVYVNPAEDAMRALMEQTLLVWGEGRVPWGDMTVELHQRRASWLEGDLQRHIAGVKDTISRHEKAVSVLTESGCVTLREYTERFGSLPVEPPVN